MCMWSSRGDRGDQWPHQSNESKCASPPISLSRFTVLKNVPHSSWGRPSSMCPAVCEWNFHLPASAKATRELRTAKQLPRFVAARLSIIQANRNDPPLCSSYRNLKMPKQTRTHTLQHHTEHTLTRNSRMCWQLAV